MFEKLFIHPEIKNKHIRNHALTHFKKSNNLTLLNYLSIDCKEKN